MRWSVKNILVSCVVLGLATVVTYPFVCEIYARYELMQKLMTVMSEQDRIAFRGWSGSATAFVQSLYARCELTYGRGAARCEAYHLALK
jgi:hypothetical protein